MSKLQLMGKVGQIFFSYYFWSSHTKFPLIWLKIYLDVLLLCVKKLKYHIAKNFIKMFTLIEIHQQKQNVFQTHFLPFFEIMGLLEQIPATVWHGHTITHKNTFTPRDDFESHDFGILVLWA